MLGWLLLARAFAEHIIVFLTNLAEYSGNSRCGHCLEHLLAENIFCETGNVRG
jgi:hypothetical protein